MRIQIALIDPGHGTKKELSRIIEPHYLDQPTFRYRLEWEIYQAVTEFCNGQPR